MAAGAWKVYLSGFVYTTLITISCYIMKSYDILVHTEKSRISDTNGLDTDLLLHRKGNCSFKTVKSIVEEEIYWSQELENLLPQGNFLSLFLCICKMV